MPLEEEAGAAEAAAGVPEAAATAAEGEELLWHERHEPFVETPEAAEELMAAAAEELMAAVPDILIPAAADDGDRVRTDNPVPNTNEGTEPYPTFLTPRFPEGEC